MLESNIRDRQFLKARDQTLVWSVQYFVTLAFCFGAADKLLDRKALGQTWLSVAVIAIVAMALRRFVIQKRTRVFAREGMLAVAAVGIFYLCGHQFSWTFTAVLSTYLLAALFRAGVCLIQYLASSDAGRKSQESLRVTGLVAFTWISFYPYWTSSLVGPLDARWYAGMMTDFILQLRQGVFPVLTGQTNYNFWGGIHPHRSAPAHENIAAILDYLTGRKLTPIALQHLDIVLVGLLGALVLYTALRRLSPKHPWLAFYWAIVYASSPAILFPLVQYDMYMTWTAGPVVVFVLYSTARFFDNHDIRHAIQTGIGCAALWFCHPPIALFSCLVVAFLLSGKFIFDPFSSRSFVSVAIVFTTFLILATPYFYSMREINSAQESLFSLVLLLGALFALALGAVKAVQTRRWIWFLVSAAGPSAFALSHSPLLKFSEALLVLLGLWVVLARVYPRLTGLTFLDHLQ